MLLDALILGSKIFPFSTKNKNIRSLTNIKQRYNNLLFLCLYIWECIVHKKIFKLNYIECKCML